MALEYRDVRSRFPLSAVRLNEMRSERWEFIQTVCEQETAVSETAYVSYFKREKKDD